jgi:hypothetical protein
VAIEAVTLSSLQEAGTLAQFGDIRFDQSFYLVGVEATTGDEEDDDDVSQEGNS